MVKVDETKVSDLSEYETSISKDIENISNEFGNIRSFNADNCWKGKSYDNYLKAFNYVDQYATNVIESYNSLKAIIDELIQHTDSFTTDSPSVLKLDT